MATAPRSTQKSDPASPTLQGDETDCPECPGDVVVEGDETLCSECGLVLDEDRIDHGPDWRSFDDGDGDGDAGERCGGARTQLRHDRGLGGETNFRSPYAEGDSRRLSRLDFWQSRTAYRDKQERTSAQAFGIIRRLGAALGVGEDTKQLAGRIWTEAQEADAVRGRSIEAIAGGALVAACRIHRCGRRLEEIAARSSVSDTRVRTGYHVLQREVGVPVPPPRPQDRFERRANAIDAPGPARTAARRLLEAATDAGVVTGRSPDVVLAAVFYATGRYDAGRLWDGDRPLQDDLADVCSTCPQSIRSVWRLLRDELDLEEVLGR